MPAPALRRLEGHAGNAFDFGHRVAHRVERHARCAVDPARLAEVQPSGQLAHDQQIGSPGHLRLERAGTVAAGPDPRRTQVRVHAKALAQGEQAALRALG